MEPQLLGDSIQIKEILDVIKQVAPTDISILITGESGTGKELVASAIHYYSKRRNKPFITVNCGAIPEGIIESELFGHQKGAFTGAIDSRAGYFEMADKGTIFLDEIGDMPIQMQVKILRVLETGEYMKVGSSKSETVDVRVIAATNRNLARDVMNKNFREDLYFRLKSINIHIPPLRERKSDVRILFNNFADNFCRKNNIVFRGIEEEAMDYLLNYAWTGNARELRNFTESILVLIPDKKLTLEDVKKNLRFDFHETRQLPALQSYNKESLDKNLIMRALFELKSDIMDIKHLLNENNAEMNFKNDEDFVLRKDDVLNMSQEEIDKEIINYLLKINHWNVNKVSKFLGQSSRNIYRKIKKYNLTKE